MSNRKIYLNQDDSAFTRCHPLEDMSIAGLEKLVDYYAQGSQLGGLAFCVNMQRALFDSAVWETIVERMESRGGTALATEVREIAGTAALLERGIDHFSVWLQRARKHGIEAFLTMRMNDCHGLESHSGFERSDRGADQDHFSTHATSFWKSNKHLRRAPYRFERSFEGAFDYAHEEVRRHHLALITELFERFDMDGLELDWMRWMFMFAPGKEAAGRDILSNFIAEVDQLRKAAEKRLGHKIELRHRVPAEPQTCLALGYDAPAWARQGMADQIILSCFGGVANFDYPIEIWRQLLGSNVRILAHVESSTNAYPGQMAVDYHFSYGSASSALKRGADGVYLFNECYREAGPEPERKLLIKMLNTLGAEKTLNTVVRRHAVSYPQTRAPGEALRTQLPIPMKNPFFGQDAGRWAENITLRIDVGSKPEAAKYVLRLGFSGDTNLQGLTVRVNGGIVATTSEPAYHCCTVEAFPDSQFTSIPTKAQRLMHYDVPATLLLEGVNVVEFEPTGETGQLEWAEILVIPS